MSTPPFSTPPVLTTPAISLAKKLEILESSLEEAKEGFSTLVSLGTERERAQLLQIHLGTLLRRGPKSRDSSPLRKAETEEEALLPLLRAATEAATAGALEVPGALRLRKILEHLQRLLIAQEFWRPDATPWWGPLPDLSPLEDLWQELEESLKEALHDAGEAARYCTDTACETPWRVLAGWLPPVWTERLYETLEAAFTEGRLKLEPGAVGQGKISVRRSDLVHYLRGTEPELLALCPALALLLQWGLGPLAAKLSKKASGPLFPPQRAMLTRYPAPSGGYAAHLDNPGGEADNGRCLTLVIYLNPPTAPCTGGELALWRSGRDLSQPPDEAIRAGSGTAAFFDPRRVPHQVLPLEPGPARWALTFWLSTEPQEPPLASPALPSLTDLLLTVTRPPLLPDRALLHRLEGPEAKGRLEILPVPSRAPGLDTESPADTRCRGALSLGLVTTVYRTGSRLEAWCRHHLELGVAHLLVIQDHGDEPEEEQIAKSLRRTFSPQQLTLWNGDELQRQDWQGVERDPANEELRSLTRQGAASWAHAARQTLNATLALRAARRGELGELPWTWILHLDGDELFVLEGSGRGGESLEEHLTLLEAADLDRVRYLNHELLLSRDDASAAGPPAFKISPRLASARLGSAGWRSLQSYLRLAPEDQSPYFRAYTNGKSAVRVTRATAAGGVHGWCLENEGEAHPGKDACLAGPSILHCHLPTAEEFRQAYVAKAQAPTAPDSLPFSLSPLEVAAVALIRGASHRQGGNLGESLDEDLERLYRDRVEFPQRVKAFLEEANLVHRPQLEEFTRPLWGRKG